MSNRAFSIPAAWAGTAETTIPPTPVPNTTYRDTTIGTTEANEGYPYAKIVDSSVFNQYLYLATLLLIQEQAQGILSWSPTQAYTVANGALVFGSDGQIYKCLANSTNQDPVVATTYWKKLDAQATTSTQGIIQLATSAEVIAGTDANKAVTPSTLSSKTSTTSAIGLVQLATSAEAIAGADALKAITPASLADAFVSSKTANGYVKIPGGIIIQWGIAIVPENSYLTVTFPTPFTTACFGVYMSNTTGSTLNSSLCWTNDITTSSFQCQHPDTASGIKYQSAYWFAIGV